MLNRLWKGSAPLTATGLFMIGVLALTLAGLVVDPRVITGAPAWLKPAKFAASITIYTLTLAWIFSLIPEWTRTRRIVERTTAFVMVLEIALISLQAFRGTTSHFNGSSPFDMAVSATMGLAILIQTLSTIAVAVALWRTPLVDRALGWALRLGMTITIVGAFSGGLMLRPSDQQLAAARTSGEMPLVGAHTVGAPDGGPGLPGTGWSTEHGDLRIPHFIGLHALQVLPIVALVLARRKVGEPARVRMTFVAAASYITLYGILVTQALRGQSVLSFDGLTLALLSVWLVGTVVAAALSTTRLPLMRRPAVV